MIIHKIYGYTQLRRLLALILTTKLNQLPKHDIFWHNGTKWTLWEMEESKASLFPAIAVVKWDENGVFVFPNYLFEDVSASDTEILGYLDFMDLFE